MTERQSSKSRFGHRCNQKKLRRESDSSAGAERPAFDIATPDGGMSEAVLSAVLIGSCILYSVAHTPPLFNSLALPLHLGMCLRLALSTIERYFSALEPKSTNTSLALTRSPVAGATLGQHCTQPHGSTHGNCVVVHRVRAAAIPAVRYRPSFCGCWTDHAPPLRHCMMHRRTGPGHMEHRGSAAFGSAAEGEGSRLATPRLHRE